MYYIDMLKLNRLGKQQVTYIYNEHLQRDFISNEVKPLDMIFKAMDEDIYECLGIYDMENTLGYAFLVRLGEKYLLDYFAVFEENRNKGTGSKILKVLSEYLTNALNIIIEVENPEYADNLQHKEIQSRRINFYLRNGCIDTKVRVHCFGVPFILLDLKYNHRYSKDTIEEIYKSFYKKMLPPQMYCKNIIIDK